MARKRIILGEETLTNERQVGAVYSRWGGGGRTQVLTTELTDALAQLRSAQELGALHAAGFGLCKALQADTKKFMEDRGLVHVHLDSGCPDFPLELMALNEADELSFAGLRLAVSHRFTAGHILPLHGTVQRVFLVDGSENALSVKPPGRGAVKLDPIPHDRIERLIDALSNYPPRTFSAGALPGNGLYLVCDGADPEKRARDLAVLMPGPGPAVRAEALQSIILYAGHVVYGSLGEPMLVFGDQLVPVERLFALDSRPELIVLAGCGPDRDDFLLSAPRRLMTADPPGERAFGVVCGSYPVPIDAAVDLCMALLKKMTAAAGRVRFDALLREAREETCGSTPDAGGVLGFRYFGDSGYMPQLQRLHQKWYVRLQMIACAALEKLRRRWGWLATLLTVALAAALLAALIRPAEPPTPAPTAVPTAAAGTPEPIASPAPGPIALPAPENAASPAPENAAPSFGDVAMNSDGTLSVTVLNWTDDIALGAFLQVRGDGSWYCKDAGMAREGNRFTVRWRAEGTEDDQAEKIALFLYPKSEVRTTTSYGLVKARSVASKELAGLLQ